MGNSNRFENITHCNETCACKGLSVSFFFAYILVNNRFSICTRRSILSVH